MKLLKSRPIIRSLIQLAVPIIFANLLQIVYQFTDLFWVGRHGTEEIAAISLAGPIIFFFVALGIGFTIAGSILVAQYKGNKNHEAMNHVVGQAMLLTTISSIVLSVIGYIFAPQVISFMGADISVAEQAISYLKISFIGMIFSYGYMSVQGLLRGLGEVKLPMFIVLGSVLLNFIVDPLFIMGYAGLPEYGVIGAALATICTQSLAYIAILLLMYRKKSYGIHFKKSYFKLKKQLIKKVLTLGIPSSIEMSARSLGMLFLTYIVAKFGTTVIAVYGIGQQVLSIMIFVSVGLSMATTTLVGQAAGARNQEKINSIGDRGFKISLIFLTMFGILVFLFAKPIIGVFSPNDPEVVKGGTQFLKIIALFFGSIGIQQVVSGILRGVGDTKIPMVFTIISLWIIQIPFAYFGSLYWGEVAIWISIPVSNVLVALISRIWYKRGSRKQKQLISSDESFV